MTVPKLGLAGIAAMAVLAFSTSEASAQFLPAQYFAPGYGAYYNNYITPYGGQVRRTSFTTPYGTNYSNSYYNPYTGFGSSNNSFQSYGNYNNGLISPSLNPYYGGPGYGNYFVQPGFGIRVR